MNVTDLYEIIPQYSSFEVTNTSVLIVENLIGALAYAMRDF